MQMARGLVRPVCPPAHSKIGRPVSGYAIRPAGLSPLQVARDTGPGAFAHLIDRERIVGNLHRAYAELEGGDLGRPLDVVKIFGEMIEYNGGALPECLA
jgi:cyclase